MRRDGKGSPRTTVGFDTPLPDFTDCAFATAEADVDWHAVVHEGGRIRGLARHMPAFGDALTRSQIAAADRLRPPFLRRTRVAARRPELSARLLHRKSVSRERGGLHEHDHARRRCRGRQRARLRAALRRPQPDRGGRAGRRRPNQEDGWNGGLGDVALAFRRTFLANVADGHDCRGRRGSGVPDRRCGSRPRQRLPRVRAVRDVRTGAAAQLVPADAWRTRDSVGYDQGARKRRTCGRRSASRTWRTAASDGPGRRRSRCCWRTRSASDAEWDVVPQLQVSLSKIQHVVVAGGVRMPVNARDERGTAVVTYLLWDWFDGPFTSFWK